jgi:hypothetical protein
LATSVNAKFFLDMNEWICYEDAFGRIGGESSVSFFEFHMANFDFHIQTMVGVAQVVEPQVVALVVVGSSPITHPIQFMQTIAVLTVLQWSSALCARSSAG